MTEAFSCSSYRHDSTSASRNPAEPQSWRQPSSGTWARTWTRTRVCVITTITFVDEWRQHSHVRHSTHRQSAGKHHPSPVTKCEYERELSSRLGLWVMKQPARHKLYRVLLSKCVVNCQTKWSLTYLDTRASYDPEFDLCKVTHAVL
jgi:hypothetical protein